MSKMRMVLCIIDKLGYSLDYIVKVDEESSQTCFSIIQMDLNLDRIGLVGTDKKNADHY